MVFVEHRSLREGPRPWLVQLSREEQILDEHILNLGQRSAEERTAFLILFLFARAEARQMTRGGSLDPGFLAAVRAVFAAVEDQLRTGDFAPIDVTPTPSGAARCAAGPTGRSSAWRRWWW